MKLLAESNLIALFLSSEEYSQRLLFSVIVKNVSVQASRTREVMCMCVCACVCICVCMCVTVYHVYVCVGAIVYRKEGRY